jgi:hypothetical protein
VKFLDCQTHKLKGLHSKDRVIALGGYVVLTREYLRGKYHCTIDLLFDLLGISCMTTDNFCFYLQNRQIQTSQTGGHWYSDTSPF